MNALTAAELSARDMPFETLDTTARCLTRHGGEVVLSETIGFIRRLPERLLAGRNVRCCASSGTTPADGIVVLPQDRG